MDIRKTTEWLKSIETLNIEHRQVQDCLAHLPSVLDQMKELMEKEGEILAYMQNNIELQKGRISKLNADVQKLEEDLVSSEKRATEITNQKEYQAIHKEIEALKSRKVLLSSQMETEQKTLSELESKLITTKNEWDGHQNIYNTKQPKVTEFFKGLQKKQKDLAKRIGNIQKELPETVTQIIHKLSENNVYPFISEALQNNVCSACHMRYPAQIILTAVKEGILSQCVCIGFRFVWVFQCEAKRGAKQPGIREVSGVL